MTTIVIDPGHGGTLQEGHSTPIGAVGPTGLREKDLTLEVARRMAPHFEGRAVLTRSADQNLTLGRRIGVARRSAADIFLSLHANAGAPGAHGTEVWVHERCGQESASLAQAVSTHLRRLGPAVHVMRGALGVLSPEDHARGTAACLVELDYLSDHHAEARLRDPGALDSIAAALAQATRGARLGFGRGGPAQALDARALDEKWPSRPAKLIPNVTSDTKQLEYRTSALEAIGAVFGVDAWDKVVAAGEQELEKKLTDALEAVNDLLGEEAAAFAASVGLLFLAELAPLGAGVAGAREKVARDSANTGFALGLAWTADDRVPTEARKGAYAALWNVVDYPSRDWDDAIPRISRNCRRMGMIAGMIAGRQLTTTQKNNLFSDLEYRNLHLEDIHMDWFRLWEDWNGPNRPLEFYQGAAGVFMRHHLDEAG